MQSVESFHFYRPNPCRHPTEGKPASFNGRRKTRHNPPIPSMTRERKPKLSPHRRESKGRNNPPPSMGKDLQKGNKPMESLETQTCDITEEAKTKYATVLDMAP